VEKDKGNAKILAHTGLYGSLIFTATGFGGLSLLVRGMAHDNDTLADIGGWAGGLSVFAISLSLLAFFAGSNTYNRLQRQPKAVTA
jgi:hypothetical protein